jgi:hypothetical protein
MQDRIFRIVEIFLHRTAGPYIWVKSGGRKIGDAKSGLPSIPDPPQATKMVGLGPLPALSRARKAGPLSQALSPVGVVFISLRPLARVVSRVDVVYASRPGELNLDDRLLAPRPSVMWVFCRVRIQ